MDNINTLLDELVAIDFFKPNTLCVIGCSTSEVIGERIGTNSSDEVAKVFFEAFQRIHKQTGVDFCFQGCEHINRAITMERRVQERYGFEIVSVVPVKGAGGSMSSLAYQSFEDPVVVEHVVCDIGIDIGQTLIGQHIKHVQIPVRVATKKVGEAVVTIATHRPKLIGGSRSQY
ncbi:TIGR01440 family protein [Macrococcoides bohemicum]|uniref:TIGR01440 family protein n=1 Tax=Macrococcoides bohemicum TaxID=1903056 RepID=UPI00165D93C6|nr:TIGR01440 family protein [Macrococcus bohemicus]MBC9875376.1 TIGR01440 family protein [Macrococcus bohemicus]QYA44531.1 TIGR01440 family protein [Macrococcus bohemicus]